jgi:hypothetical protein
VAAKPDNWEEINRRLSQPRPSLSPTKFSEEAYEKFVQADADAVKEKQVYLVSRRSIYYVGKAEMNHACSSTL